LSKTKIDENNSAAQVQKEYKLVYEKLNDYIHICQRQIEDEDLQLPDNNLLYYNFSSSINSFSDKFIELLCECIVGNVR
jgi:hypothetical protein